MKVKLFIITSLILVVSMFKIQAQTFEVDEINYNIISANEVEVISKPTCYDGTLNIPETVTNTGITYTIIRIGFEAFKNCDITSISLPSTIIEIGEYAFRDCRDLATITLPDSVTVIGEGAFLYCTILETINIPDLVTSIERYTFSQCGQLTTITIPESVASIGTYAFSNCFSLATVNTDIVAPIDIASQVFFHLDLAQMSLNVPVGSESAYNTASVWQNFGTINNVLNTSEFSESLGLKIVQNLATNSIIVFGLSSVVTYNIYDLSGIIVSSGEVSNQNPIRIDSLNKGIYILRFGDSFTKKIVKY